jgi:hypothetical protein
MLRRSGDTLMHGIISLLVGVHLCLRHKRPFPATEVVKDCEITLNSTSTQTFGTVHLDAIALTPPGL